MRKTIKKVLKGIGNATEKAVKEIERQELAKAIIPKEKGFLEKRIVNHKTDDGERQILELDDSVCFVLVTKDKLYTFSSQFRASRGMTSTSIYGGYVDNVETNKQTAIREMYEECNVSSDQVESIEWIYEGLYPSLGICTEKTSLCLIYLKSNLDELDIKSNDPNESVTPVALTKDEVKDLNLDGMKAWIAQTHITNKAKFEELRTQKDRLENKYVDLVEKHSNLEFENETLKDKIKTLEGHIQEVENM